MGSTFNKIIHGMLCFWAPLYLPSLPLLLHSTLKLNFNEKTRIKDFVIIFITWDVVEVWTYSWHLHYEFQTLEHQQSEPGLWSLLVLPASQVYGSHPYTKQNMCDVYSLFSPSDIEFNLEKKCFFWLYILMLVYNFYGWRATNSFRYQKMAGESIFTDVIQIQRSWGEEARVSEQLCHL